MLVTGLVGILLGVGSRFADMQENALTWFGSLAAPWIVASFLLGSMAGTRSRGAGLATSAMLIGVACYYALMRIIEGGANPGYLSSISAIWLMLGPVAGAVFGLAGAAWRRTDEHWLAPVLAIALTSGAIVGESVFMAATTRELSTGGYAILGGFAGAGAVLPGLLLPDARVRLAGYGAMAIIAVAGLAAVPVVRALFALSG